MEAWGPSRTLSGTLPCGVRTFLPRRLRARSDRPVRLPTSSIIDPGPQTSDLGPQNRTSEPDLRTGPQNRPSEPDLRTGPQNRTSEPDLRPQASAFEAHLCLAELASRIRCRLIGSRSPRAKGRGPFFEYH